MQMTITPATEGQSIPIPILARGKDWLVVDKPAGISVHNMPGQDVCSLVSAFVEEDGSFSGQGDGEKDSGVSPVHRLDKETSGILLLATTAEAFRFFSRQFESHQVQKRYIAILHGRLAAPQGDDSWGTWDRALTKSAGGRRHPEGTGRRRTAETLYRIMDYSTHYTMVEIELHTGRKHQIRRHAKMAGHAVVGDTRYGSKRAADYLKKNLDFSRLALHAQALTLQIPERTEPDTIVTSEVPGQILELFKNDPES